MPPNREGTPGTANFELPVEQPEKLADKTEQGPDKTAERLPARPDDIPAADTPVIAAPANDSTNEESAAHQATKDRDHIETEWVDKAKAIIAQNKNDPYIQKHEMSKVKAEYIQKRFGKTIKTDEAAA
jgi:hypothetical protein